MREGRGIFDNIRKFLRYLLSSNIGEVLTMFLGVLAAGADSACDAPAASVAVPLLATQILWINLLTDGARRWRWASTRGRRRDGRAHRDGSPTGSSTREMIVTIVLIGDHVMRSPRWWHSTCGLAGGLLGGDGDIETARTMAFTTLVLAQLFNAFNARSDRVSAFVRPFENRILWLAVVVTVGCRSPWCMSVAAECVRYGSARRRRMADPLALASAVLWVDEIRKLVHRRGSGAAAEDPIDDLFDDLDRRSSVGLDLVESGVGGCPFGEQLRHPRPHVHAGQQWPFDRRLVHGDPCEDRVDGGGQAEHVSGGPESGSVDGVDHQAPTGRDHESPAFGEFVRESRSRRRNSPSPCSRKICGIGPCRCSITRSVSTNS